MAKRRVAPQLTSKQKYKKLKFLNYSSGFFHSPLLLPLQSQQFKMTTYMKIFNERISGLSKGVGKYSVDALLTRGDSSTMIPVLLLLQMRPWTVGF